MKNEELTIGIIAGTPIDTQMGNEFFKNHGVNTIGKEIATTPEEATTLQVLHQEQLEQKVVERIETLKEQKKIQSICIFFNSLSTAINSNTISSKTRLNIVTPLGSYHDIATRYNNIGVLGANCQAVKGIEEIIKKVNQGAHVVGTGTLKLVKAIEKKEKPVQIIEDTGIASLLKFYEKSKVDTLILGCTHFPYIKKELTKRTTIKIFDPAEDMLRRIQFDTSERMIV
ncbi:aspartate/glutamate racemase family protein [Natranaerobius trueperi]|uniref:Uncharacterized protein n=1 Tax=Natranaerobius trueperi TaxID=759412 RepID=A0A226C0G0_9FIRM|nr:aspartate/glutamate racemase family protein [Natranaerobius trueperi]OWZ84655.1 hypothetical protein CDO51_02525 [Natranaerobius trueperi]